MAHWPFAQLNEQQSEALPQALPFGLHAVVLPASGSKRQLLPNSPYDKHDPEQQVSEPGVHATPSALQVLAVQRSTPIESATQA